MLPAAAPAAGALLRLPSLLARGGHALCESLARPAPTPRSPAHAWARCLHGRGVAQERKRIVFLGTPQVSSIVLEELLRAAAAPGSDFEVAAVVSRPSGRHWAEREAQAEAEARGAAAPAGAPPPPPPLASPPPGWSRHGASPVERLALQSGLPPERILCPVSANEPAFLDALRRLRPHLAVTAAYGAMLPQSFLDLPQYGTLNIHPSLLPRYRGPAPVQRALQAGCAVGGVSLAYTVLRCDAGPVLEQQQVPIPPDVQCPELTEALFRLGAAMLLRRLPEVLSGATSAADAVPQEEAIATYAPKVSRQEAALDFRLSARACHDHVRAMAGWPGARAALLLEARGTGACEPIEIKVLRTRVVPSPPPSATGAGAPGSCGGGLQAVSYTAAGELLVPCGDGSMLKVLEVGRRGGGLRASSTPLSAKEFVAGLSKRRLLLPSRQ